MSKIEVNTVEPQCGTTLTLGGSGDTVALGSGASQTGFGRTGTVDWVTTPKVTGDSPVTGVSGKGYFLNTTGGAITLNLPAGSAGDIISLKDYANTWQTYNVTVVPNGSQKIGGEALSSILSTEAQSLTFVYVDSVQGWVNTMDSTANVIGALPFIAASGTGCTTITCGDYKTHIFTGPGSLVVSAAGTPVGSTILDYFVVAGGANGGNGYLSGGGGAGGFRTSNTYSVPNSPPLANPTGLTAIAQTYPVVVGGGGAKVPAPPVTVGTDGDASSFGAITSAGGGGGGVEPTKARDGGSGGGENGYGPSSPAPGAGVGSGNTPPVSPPQGNDGGTGGLPGGGAPLYLGGGGGGAGAVGVSCNPPGNCGGAGSYLGDTFVGPTAPSYGEPGPVSNTRYFGGGGGGGWNTPGVAGNSLGGVGGGGDGAGNAGDGGDAVVNTGGGGGGVGNNSPTWNSGGAGGSGIVMIRYKFQ